MCTVILTGCKNTPLIPSAYKGSSQTQEAIPEITIGEDYSSKKPAMVINDDTTPRENEIPATEPETDSFEGYVLSEEEKSSPNVICKNTAETGVVTLAFVGDINFDDGYSNMINYRNNGSTMAAVLSPNLLSLLNSADIAMANNEFPYSNGGTPLSGKTFTFRAKPETVKNLNEMGIDIVSLANNHAMDHGREALLDTFSTLNEAGIPFVGAGKNIEEACTPVYFIAGGMKIAFVSATQIERTYTPDTKEATATEPGVLRTLDPARFLQVINEADNNADLTIVYVHWGSENTYEVDSSQRELAAKYVEAGADLIIGDHAHVLQGFEYINDVPIIYSVGNFWFSSKDIDSCVILARAKDKKIESIQFIPCVQHNCRTDMYEKGDSEYNRLLGVIAGLSYNVSVDENGYIYNGQGNGIAPAAPKPIKKAAYQTSADETVNQAGAVTD